MAIDFKKILNIFKIGVKDVETGAIDIAKLGVATESIWGPLDPAITAPLALGLNLLVSNGLLGAPDPTNLTNQQISQIASLLAYVYARGTGGAAPDVTSVTAALQGHTQLELARLVSASNWQDTLNQVFPARIPAVPPAGH